MMPNSHSTDFCSAGDIVLLPGDWHFAGGNTRIRTLLGTCVSLVLWHPRLRIGGMCHYMLPGSSPQSLGGLDGRYADDAFRLLEVEILDRGTRLSEYRMKMTGGGNMFPNAGSSSTAHVGTRNADSARELARRHDLQCDYEHLEGIGHREVVFDVHAGRIQVRQVPIARVEGTPARGAIPCAA